MSAKLVLLLVLSLVVIYAAKIPTKQAFQTCFSTNCPFSIQFWDSDSVQAYQNFMKCVTNVQNPKCISGYQAYNFELPTSPLPQDFLDCHQQCNPKSTIDFVQNVEYACLVACETTAQPPKLVFPKISALKTCQAKCPICDPQDILCNAQQAQFNSCRNGGNQC